MKSEPLNANEHLKVSVSIVLGLLISWIFLIFGGFIPVAMLAYGYFMMRKNRDFAHVEASVKYAKAYFRILVVLALIAAAVLLALALIRDTEIYAEVFRPKVYGIFSEDFVRWDIVASPLLLSLVFCVCVIAINRLYFTPLKDHEQWVSNYGIFSKEQRRLKQSISSSDGGPTS